MNIPVNSRGLLFALAAGVVALAATTGVRAQHEHGHEHDSSATAVAQLKLDGEKKWPTGRSSAT